MDISLYVIVCECQCAEMHKWVYKSSFINRYNAKRIKPINLISILF